MGVEDTAGEQSSGSTDELEFFWRPGCPFCMMLERDLEQAGIAVTRRNIWDEPEAAAIVRSVADGNETVPTVRIADRALVNPPIAEVAKLLAEVAPDLLPSS
ncbi:MAG: glutaredoxin domain-containing protein [Actinomycetota bacterium]